MIEQNLCKCKKCGNLILRKLDGKFPSKNKKWVNEEGKQWSGKTCPDCQRKLQLELQRKRRGKI